MPCWEGLGIRGILFTSGGGGGGEIQKEVLGDMDPRVGETCRYVVEAHVPEIWFSQAEKFFQRVV